MSGELQIADTVRGLVAGSGRGSIDGGTHAQKSATGQREVLVVAG